MFQTTLSLIALSIHILYGRVRHKKKLQWSGLRTQAFNSITNPLSSDRIILSKFDKCYFTHLTCSRFQEAHTLHPCSTMEPAIYFIFSSLIFLSNKSSSPWKDQRGWNKQGMPCKHEMSPTAVIGSSIKNWTLKSHQWKIYGNWPHTKFCKQPHINFLTW